MNDNMQVIKFSELIWLKIRERQKLEGFTDEELASILGVNIRTLKNYDKLPSSIKLERLDRLLINTDFKLLDFYRGVFWDSKSGHYKMDWNDIGDFTNKKYINYWCRYDRFVPVVLLWLLNKERNKKEGDEHYEK